MSSTGTDTEQMMEKLTGTDQNQSTDDLRHVTSADIASLVKKLDDIDQTMHWLESHLFFRAHRGWLSVFFFQLMRGLALGLGSVLGATVVLYGVVYLLNHIDFIPIIGSWADQVIDVLKENDTVKAYIDQQQTLEVSSQPIADSDQTASVTIDLDLHADSETQASP